MPGRPRKPSKLRELEGNPGRTPIPKEPEVPALDGTAPPWLSKDARVLWNEFIPQIRQWIFASKLDEPLLLFLCGTWGMAMQAQRKLKREGITRDGHKNPAAQIWKDNVSLFLQIGSRFGMTPADRARLFAGEKPKGDEAQAGGRSTLDGDWVPTQRPN